jgi:hypothetical protein
MTNADLASGAVRLGRQDPPRTPAAAPQAWPTPR